MIFKNKEAINEKIKSIGKLFEKSSFDIKSNDLNLDCTQTILSLVHV